MHVEEPLWKEKSYNLKHSLTSVYNHLSLSDLLLLLNLRSLPTEGSHTELSSRLADHDILLFGDNVCHTSRVVPPKLHRQITVEFPDRSPGTYAYAPSPSPPPPSSVHTKKKDGATMFSNAQAASTPTSTKLRSSLPSELWATIMDFLGDWELSMALGLPTYLRRPSDWEKIATPIDYAILTGSVEEVKRTITENSDERVLLDNISSGKLHIGTITKRTAAAALKFSDVGGKIMCRFGFTDLLTYFWTQDPNHFLTVLGGTTIPHKASMYNEPVVLDWWLSHSSTLPKFDDLSSSSSASGPVLYRNYGMNAVDSASRNGHIRVLDWWLSSGLVMSYSEAALEGASVSGHVDVLDWWNRSNLTLRVGRVMDLASVYGHVNVLDWWLASGLPFTYDKALYNASYSGRIDVLNWWLNSGLRLVYDSSALFAATYHNKPEVLEWWKRSGLPIEYRICDIEEALEDAVGSGDESRRWWMAQAVNFKASNKEWAETKTL